MKFRSPLPHQLDALHYSLSRSSVALFMEMRLGKTLVCIRWAQSRKSAYPVLVVAPLTVLPSWEYELQAEGVSPEHIVTVDSARPVQGVFCWALVNYERIRANPELLTAPWRTIICDESARIRNPKAQITKLLCLSTAHVPNKAILSGLPAPESPLDYFCQYQFLQGHFAGFRNFWGYRLHNFASDSHGWDWWPKPGVSQKIKEYVHSTAFVLTRKQANIGSRKIYERRYVPMTLKQHSVYRRAEKDFELELRTTTKSTIWNTTKLLWMSRIAGGFSSDEENTVWSYNKVTELLDLLSGELSGEPVVIWFRFNRELREVAARLKDKYVLIVGDTSLSDRRERLKMFQSGMARLLLAQVKCAKFGLDCSRASTAIYYSNGYDYEDRAQSEDRIVHPQKTEPLLYLDLVTKDSIDEAVIETLGEKHINSRVFMTRLIERWRERR